MKSEQQETINEVEPDIIDKGASKIYNINWDIFLLLNKSDHYSNTICSLHSCPMTLSHIKSKHRLPNDNTDLRIHDMAE